MQALICAGCGRSFEGLRPVEEPHGERRLTSPCCGEGFSTAQRCGHCGNLAEADSLRHGLCRACCRWTVEEFKWYLSRRFSPEQREILNEEYDGVSLA